MSLVAASLTVLVAASAALIGLVIARPRLTDHPGGKILAFVAFLVLPTSATAIGLMAHLEHAKSTTFCLSCHVMTPYGESLAVDSEEHLPARHYQNKLMPRENACFACHTTYTMFGDVQAKMRGLRHVWVQYFGTIPETIELYEPYRNRECLSCHGDARSFEQQADHMDVRTELASNEISCLDCHDLAHDVSSLDDLPRWTGGEE